MALTQINIGGISDSGSFLSPMTALQSVDVQSDISLTGEMIYINPNYFQDVGAANFAPVALPTVGYAFQYPAATGVITVPLMTFPGSELWKNIELKVDIVSNTEFTIWTEGLFTSDLNGFFNANAAPDNLSRIYKNRQSNSANFDNSGNSVYNRNKQITYSVVYEETASPGTLHNVFASKTITARFLASGLYNNAGHFSNFDYQLERNGNQVSNLSVFENTTVRFNLTGANNFPACRVAVVRVDDVTNSSSYYEDLELNYGVLAGSSFIQQFTELPITAFVSGSYTNTGGDNWEGVVELNKDYFTQLGRYRLYFIAEQLPPNQHFETYYTEVEIVADAPPAPSYGNMSSVVQTYDSGSTDYIGNCVIGLAPRERVRVKSVTDIASYDAAILANNTFGSFTDNLETVFVYFTQSPRINNNEPPPVTNEFPTKEADGTYFIDLRIPDNWAGDVYYVVFVYVFRLGTSPGDYYDYISHPIKLQVNEFDTSFSINTQVGAQDVVKICRDNADVAVVTASHPTYDSTYSFFAGINENISAAALEEENGYNNNNLPRLDSEKITFIENDLTGNDAILSVDSVKLSEGAEYALTVFAKGGNVVPPVCASSDIETTQSTILQNNNIQKITFSLTSVLTNSEIVNIFVSIQNGNGNVIEFDSGGTNSINHQFDYYSQAASPVIKYSVVIDLQDGCQVSGSVEHETDLGGSQTLTTTLNP